MSSLKRSGQISGTIGGSFVISDEAYNTIKQIRGLKKQSSSLKIKKYYPSAKIKSVSLKSLKAIKTQIK